MAAAPPPATTAGAIINHGEVPMSTPTYSHYSTYSPAPDVPDLTPSQLTQLSTSTFTVPVSNHATRPLPPPSPPPPIATTPSTSTTLSSTPTSLPPPPTVAPFIRAISSQHDTSIEIDSSSYFNTNADNDDGHGDDDVGMNPTAQGWSDRFQSLMELAESSTAHTTVKYRALAALAVDFVECAKTYGRIIISEMFLPPSRRSIHPINIGGTAGGDKYLVRDILFKLTVDPYIVPPLPSHPFHVYGGPRAVYEFAAKASGHALRAAASYLQAGWQSHGRGDGTLAPPQLLRIPLQTLVEYRGFRLFASSFLSLTKDILYGSADGGATIHTADAYFNDLMRVAADRLHLAPHLVLGHLLTSAGDVEGRRGVDGRLYLLDLVCIFTGLPHSLFSPQSGQCLDRRVHFLQNHLMFVVIYP
jgi:hypothetical protein